MGIKGKAAVTAAMAGLAALGSMPAASATTSYTSYTVYANLDGDSARDRVTVSTGVANQIHVKFKLDDGRTAERDMNLSGSVVHPKIHDIYNDGKDEVGVPIGTGNGTNVYALYRYDPSMPATSRVRAVKDSSGKAFEFDWGPNATPRTEYRCTTGATRFDQITAYSAGGTRWNITRQMYKVSQNAVTLSETRKYPNVSSDHPLLHLDPSTCN